MTTANMEQRADLIVIGTGLAGLSATAFATAWGLKTIQVGLTSGGILFASGLLDLLGVHPLGTQNKWEDPWTGIASLIADQPDHPYARVGFENVQRAWKSFIDILAKAGLQYRGWPGRNATLATCAGTLKTTCLVPRSMWPGVVGLKEQSPVLIVDFEGMKEFSATQMVETLGPRWPGLRAERLAFPCGLQGVERQNVFMAEAMGSPQVRDALADVIRPYLEDAGAVGMPAIFGMGQPEVVTDDLERKLGVPVFEIPTMPPSVPGFRLKETLEREALQGGAVALHGMRATAIKPNGRRDVSVLLQAGQSSLKIEAEGVVLATGRFLGGGLAARRSGIRETLLDLPVHQPLERQDWHRASFLDPNGHPVNQAGIEVDASLRPLGRGGRVAYENVFAAGSVLAHQDWVRMKCGAGLSIATAFRAVQSFMESG